MKNLELLYFYFLIPIVIVFPLLVLSQFSKSGHIAKCELEALRFGTHIADTFNSPIGNHNWHDRLHQDDIIKMLGFSPWLINGVQGSKGLSLNGSIAKDLHAQNGWISRSIDKSPYSILNHKWVYMFGDSTTRQIWASYAAPFQGNSFERNSKEWTRKYCNKQPHRVHHAKGAYFDAEGWGGPCGQNEVTCYVSGYGDEGLLTFDWKHFPYEDYDDFIWSERGPWSLNQSEKRPDILTVQLGMHTCWHGHPTGFYSKHLHDVNNTLIERHINDIPKLMAAIRSAVDRANNTLVVIVTSGGTLVENSASMDECIVRINRVAADSAHKHGFAVLERGEIERRLMYKSLKAHNPPIVPDTHLQVPAQNIIATCLLTLLNCLNATPVASTSDNEYLGLNYNSKPPPAPSILHNPP